MHPDYVQYLQSGDTDHFNKHSFFGVGEFAFSNKVRIIIS